MFFEPRMMLNLFIVAHAHKLFVFDKNAKAGTVKFVLKIVNIAVVLSNVVVLHRKLEELFVEKHVFLGGRTFQGIIPQSESLLPIQHGFTQPVKFLILLIDITAELSWEHGHELML